LYLIDVLIFLTWIYAYRIKPIQKPPMRRLVAFILVMAVMSEVAACIRLGSLKTFYFIPRMLLAGSLFFSAQRIIRTRQDLEAVLKAALPGVIITALLVVMTSLPPTRGLAQHVFSIPFLDPSAASVERWFELRYGEAARGHSLVGVSILSAAFLNTMWPLLLLLWRKSRLGIRTRNLLISTLVLVPVAVVMTYSRGAILGLSLILFTSLFFASKIRRPVVLGLGLALLFFSWVGWESRYFYFQRITQTTRAALEDPYSNYSLDQRLFAYADPFRNVISHPLNFFLGYGLGYWRPWRFHMPVETGGDSTGYIRYVHAVFSAAYYSYGLLAAFAYMLLLLNGFRMTWRFARRAQNSFSGLYAQALLAGLSGFLSWFMLGHAAVSQPRGAMLLFLVFGMAASLPNFIPEARTSAFSHQRGCTGVKPLQGRVGI